jgi:two-component system, chemotaxis family, protein-glutamate methylesterase/glutaminase
VATAAAEGARREGSTDAAGEPTVFAVVGASAGGVGALMELVRGLPAEFSGALFIVLHSAPEAPARLAAILARGSALPVAHAMDGETVEAGRVYVAAPDRHLILRRGHVHLSRGPRENGSRPAIDPLFRSAARVHGSRTVGVVLTGTLDDGTAGLLAVEAAGGVTVVQDPEEAPFPDMPRNALTYVRVDHVLPLADIPRVLIELAARTSVAPPAAREEGRAVGRKPRRPTTGPGSAAPSARGRSGTCRSES